MARSSFQKRAHLQQLELDVIVQQPLLPQDLQNNPLTYIKHQDVVTPKAYASYHPYTHTTHGMPWNVTSGAALPARASASFSSSIS